MAEVEKRNANGASEATTVKKRKGFWSNLFGRSSNGTHAEEKKDGQEPKKGGIMNSVMDNARQAATREVEHVAEQEAMKKVEEAWKNSNGSSGSQPTDTTNTASNGSSDNTTMTPSDALNASTNWAKRMVGSAQQKMQNLQNLGS